MKKMKASVQRILSVMLAAAMVATAVPQVGMYAFAEEAESGTEQIVPVNEEGMETPEEEGTVPSDEGEGQEAPQDGVVEETTPSDDVNNDTNAPTDSEEVDTNAPVDGEGVAADAPTDGEDVDADEPSDGEDVDADEPTDDEDIDADEPSDDVDSEEEENLYSAPEGDEGVMPLAGEERVVTIPFTGGNYTLEAVSSGVTVDNNGSDGKKYLSFTLPSETDELNPVKFKIVPGDDYTIRKIQGKVTVKLNQKKFSMPIKVEWETGECSIAINKGILNQNNVESISVEGSVNVDMVKIEPFTWTFDYTETDLEVTVMEKTNAYVGGVADNNKETKKTVLSADDETVEITNTSSVTLSVKVKDAAKVPFVIKDVYGDPLEYIYSEGEDGEYIFALGRSFGDITIGITAEEPWYITFESEPEKLDVEIWSIATDDEIQMGTRFPVKQSQEEPFRFTVSSELEVGGFGVFVGDEELTLQYHKYDDVDEDEDDEDGYYCYEYKPEANTTITIKYVPHKIPINYDDSKVTDLEIVGDGVELSDDGKYIEYTTGYDNGVTLKFKTAEGVRLQNIELTYDDYDDDEEQPYTYTDRIEAGDIDFEDGYYVFDEIESYVREVKINTEAGDDDTVTESKLTLEYDAKAIESIEASINGKAISAGEPTVNSEGRTEVVYSVQTDTSVRFKITAKSSYIITQGILTRGGVETPTSLGLGLTIYEPEVSVVSDARLRIVTEAASKSKLTLEYDAEAIEDIEVTAVLTGELIVNSEGRTEAVYSVPTDKTVNFKITTRSSYVITQSILTRGEVSTPTDLESLTTYETEVSAESDARLRIVTEAVSEEPDTPENHQVFVTMHEMKDDGTGAELERIKGNDAYTTNQYNVRAGRKYAVSVYINGALAQPEVKSNSFKKFGEVVSNEGSKTVDIDVRQEAQGGKYGTIALVAMGSDNSAAKITLKLTIVEDITGVTVKKLQYDADGRPMVQRPADTGRVIVVTPTGNPGTKSSALDISQLGYEFTREAGVSQDDLDVQFIYKGSNLAVSVMIGPDVELGKKLATISFYNKETGVRFEGATFYVIATEPTVLQEETPEVKVSYVDDISMVLDVSSSGEITEPHKGKQYYKVEVKPAAGETPSETIQEAIKNPFYFEREIPEEIETDDGDYTYEKLIQKLHILVDSEELRGLIDEEGTCKFDVTVSIVQTRDGSIDITAENEGELVRTGFRTNDNKKAKVPSVETKVSYIETKLTLKKGTTKLYTGQEDITAATAVFRSNTTTRWVEVADVTVGLDEDERLNVRFEDGKILVSASSQTKVCKHTLEVQPSGPDTMYRPVSTLTVTVEKGIDDLVLTSPTSIYKKANSSASLQVKITYNPGDVQPKTKKVKYSIVDEDGDVLTYDPDEEEEDEAALLYKYVTVNSSGKVSINRKLNPSEENTYSFRVKAVANDYKGNTTEALTDVITVTSEKADYNTLALATGEGGNAYKVVATNASAGSLTTDKLQGAVLIALPSGDVGVGDSVSIDDGISTDNLTVKSSNSKAVTVQIEDGRIRVTPLKPASNVKLTVTLADGSKQSKVLKLTVKTAEPEALRLSVQEDGSSLNVIENNENYKTAEFNGTVNTILTLKVMQKSGSSPFDGLYAYTNHTLKIKKGGKLLSSDVAAGEYTAIVTGKEATVTLKYKGTTETYTITNSNYSSEKAPKVSVASGTSKNIKSGQLYEGESRTMQYSLGGSNYSWSGKSVLVELNAANASAAKSRNAYEAFEEACDDLNRPVSVNDGSLKLKFNEGKIPAGSYKLTLTFGTAVAGTINADAKPVTLTVKAAAPKKTKGSYKAKTSYNIEAAPGKSVELGGTGKKIKGKAVYDEEILACNVNGKSNKFRDYFEIGYERDDLGGITASYLKFKDQDKLTQAQIDEIAQKSIGKNDLTGYVTYTVSYGDDGYGHPIPETKTVKITVKLVSP